MFYTPIESRALVPEDVTISSRCDNPRVPQAKSIASGLWESIACARLEGLN